MDNKHVTPLLLGATYAAALLLFGSLVKGATRSNRRRNPVSKRPMSGRWKLSYYGPGGTGKAVRTYHDSVAEAEAVLARKASASGLSASDRGHLWGSAEEGELAYGYPDGSVEVAYITAQRR